MIKKRKDARARLKVNSLKLFKIQNSWRYSSAVFQKVNSLRSFGCYRRFARGLQSLLRRTKKSALKGR